MRGIQNFRKLNKQFSTLKHDANKILEKYYKKNELLEGFCDLAGTTKYRKRFVETGKAHETFFTKFNDQKPEN